LCIWYSICMAETKPRMIPRSKMGGRERRLRSELARLVHGAGLIRGTLAVRERLCGKANCRCARGQRHVSLYLVVSEEGKPRQLFIPRSLEPVVRRWVSQYQRTRELLEEISRMYWDKVSRREP